LGLRIPWAGRCGTLVGDAVAAAAGLAHSLAVEVGEVVVVLLVKVNHLPTRVLDAASDTGGGFRLVGRGARVR
jgi:hypothetical protein